MAGPVFISSTLLCAALSLALLFLLSRFLFLAFNQRKNEEFFSTLFSRFIRMRLSARSASLYLSVFHCAELILYHYISSQSYVNWIRRCNYGYIYSYNFCLSLLLFLCSFFDSPLCKCICLLMVSVHFQTNGMQSLLQFLFFSFLLFCCW